jgi:hypothetical protein
MKAIDMAVVEDYYKQQFCPFTEPLQAGDIVEVLDVPEDKLHVDKGYFLTSSMIKYTGSRFTVTGNTFKKDMGSVHLNCYDQNLGWERIWLKLIERPSK